MATIWLAMDAPNTPTAERVYAFNREPVLRSDGVWIPRGDDGGYMVIEDTIEGLDHDTSPMEVELTKIG